MASESIVTRRAISGINLHIKDGDNIYFKSDSNLGYINGDPRKDIYTWCYIIISRVPSYRVYSATKSERAWVALLRLMEM